MKSATLIQKLYSHSVPRYGNPQFIILLLTHIYMPAIIKPIPNHASLPPTRSPSSLPVNNVKTKVIEFVIGTANERSVTIVN